MRSFGSALLGIIDNASLFVSVKLVPTITASFGGYIQKDKKTETQKHKKMKDKKTIKQKDPVKLIPTITASFDGYIRPV